MRKMIFIILISSLFIGCEKKFDGSLKSLEQMMDNLSMEEKTRFIQEFELVSDTYGGEYKLKGWTIEEIRSEASKIITFTKKKNIEFLENFIIEMKKDNKTSTYLHITKNGFISKPKVGYVYKKEYSIKQLEQSLLNLKQQTLISTPPTN